jgi:phenylpropionate dioxygenase-like ring-hydroxylating dioxygenase large terminal subunit
MTLTETLTGTDRSAGIAYSELLKQDTHPVSDALRAVSPMATGNTIVPASVYYSKEFHDLEVEKLWSRVWQHACHEDDIPDVGDYHVYDIAHLSFLIVRTGTGPDDIKAYRNACLHRGRMLRESNGRGAKNLRCAFHGWCWNLDGSMKEIPCEWDFPDIDKKDFNLPEAKVGRWGGIVFINPDRDAEPLEDHLKGLEAHFEPLAMEKKFKAVHVAKVIRCNWKVCQEAFMEAYHVIATHATLLETLGDANTAYDVFGNFSRAISPHAVPSPHLANQPHYGQPEDARTFSKFRHPLNGHLYERKKSGFVEITDQKGGVSVFTDQGEWVEGPLTQADPHLCLWIGGEQLPGDDPILVEPEAPEGMSIRAYLAELERERLRAQYGDKLDVDSVADAELIDSIYLSVFPNWHPWGSFNAINYRFRPNGDNPDEAIFEVMLFVPSPDGENRPPPAAVHWLAPDDDWTQAPELGMLAKIFNQDTFNLPKVQRGLKAQEQQEVVLASYNESKLRHFHELLRKWLELD